MTEKITGKDVLAVPMLPNDSGTDSVRGFLLALLQELWENGENFSAKRPFGESGWKYEVYEALARQGFVYCSHHDNGDIDVLSVDADAAEHLISDAIEELFSDPK